MSAVLLKRLAFQVGPNISENTFTLSSVSKEGHFISLRPFTKPTKEQEGFPFEWGFAGTKENLKAAPTKDSEGNVVLQQDFDMGFDTNVYLGIENTHRGVINTFWKTWDSGCLEESGKVFPFGKDKEGIPFMELWQPIDPNVKDMVMLEAGDGRFAPSSVRSVVFKVSAGQGYEGLIVVVGNWAQGYIAKESTKSAEGINFIRYYIEGDKASHYYTKFGSECNKFPTDLSSVSVNSTVTVNGLKWDIIEA
ncbi:Protein HRI1 [Nakaseomyces bracarensis]|uniref:Protein HRI1 n=1 Tax=Nakaseomyces bracarensis TaxID=273131 RepID=A0ABR4NPN8_9SACH